MSAQKASTPVRLARFAAGAVLVAVVIAVAVHLAGRRGAPRPPAVGSLPEGRAVDLKERVRHKEYREGRLVADIRGDAFFLGPDGRNHLRGSVEISNLGPAGKIVSRLTADEVVFDPGAARFTVTGRVRVESGGIVLEGDSFDYDKTVGVFGTKAGGVFSSRMLKGRAAEVSYSEGADEVRLDGGFRVDLDASGRPGQPVGLAGDSFAYHRRERRGLADGRAELSVGRCRGEARSLSFTVTGDERAIGSAVFDGAARLAVAPNGEVRAERVEVSFDSGSGLVSSVDARGDASLSLRPSAVLVRAPTVSLSFGGDGEPRAWSASGGFRAELGESGGRVLEGESAEFIAAVGVLRAAGKPGLPATADSPGARIEAASIAVGPAEGDLEASGRVKCLLKPGEGSRAGGFFSAGTAAFVSSEDLVFHGGGASASFAGNVQAWQDTDFLLAGELEFSDAAGEMRGRGGVTAGLVLPASGQSPARRVELGGEEMSFSSAGRTLSFAGKSYFRIPAARLEAGSVSAVLGRDGKAVESLTARTGVVVTRGRYEGRAGAAAYQAEAERITLTGRPVLVDRQGGSARGDKLTFDLADDNILLENEGQGRSTTVIRS